MKILIVDDNQSITKGLSRMLGLVGGYEIEVANNGYQAMDKMLSFNPKLVILDLAMPGISGQDTLLNLKKINPNTKVIIATAHADNKIKEFCLKNGASEFLEKPYTPNDIINIVKSVFTNAQYGPDEIIFLSEINEKLRKISKRIFGINHHLEFQAVEMKKAPTTQNELVPTFEIPDGQRGFTTETSGDISGSIITVVPDKFIEMIKNYSGDTVGIDGSTGLMGFFNMFNGAVLSVVGNFLNVKISPTPIRSFDNEKDKIVKDMDLLEMNYTFELEGKTTWVSIYFWMNVLPSFEKKLGDLIF